VAAAAIVLASTAIVETSAVTSEPEAAIVHAEAAIVHAEAAIVHAEAAIATSVGAAEEIATPSVAEEESNPVPARGIAIVIASRAAAIACHRWDWAGTRTAVV
jgi:hypothetical protein